MKGEECIGALKALGEENRLRILRLLLTGEKNVNTISGALAITPYNVSKHLSILKSAALVVVRKDGRERLYSVAEDYRLKLADGQKVMDLGCCSFRLDQLPK